VGEASRKEDFGGVSHLFEGFEWWKATFAINSVCQTPADRPLG
jgi:hypothetical protein